jgi:hypothetical protein
MYFEYLIILICFSMTLSISFFYSLSFQFSLLFHFEMKTRDILLFIQFLVCKNFKCFQVFPFLYSFIIENLFSIYLEIDLLKLLLKHVMGNDLIKTKEIFYFSLIFISYCLKFHFNFNL